MTGQFTYWPATYFIDLPAEITGIAQTGLGVYVFTEYKTYLITGTSHTTFAKRIFDSTQGCTSFDSIQNVKGTVMWVSSDGLCVPNGSVVDVATKDKLGKVNLTVVNSVLHDEIYYALLDTGKVLVYDFRFKATIKYLSLAITRLVKAEDILYGYADGIYYKLFEGVNQLSLSYTSPELTDGSLTMRKKYKSVFLNSTGELNIEVIIDEVSVIVKAIRTSGANEIKIPEEYKNGYKIQFRITGIGEVDELNYSVHGDSR